MRGLCGMPHNKALAPGTKAADQRVRNATEVVIQRALVHCNEGPGEIWLRDMV